MRRDFTRNTPQENPPIEIVNFRTEIPLAPVNWDIHHHSKIVVAGSCFAERISQWLMDYRFSVLANPAGIIFHPTPLVRSLTRALERKSYTEDELVFNGERYCSFDHHGSFSEQSAQDTLGRVNERLNAAANSLQSADVLIVTWGSAWDYHHIESDKVVANCHKLPGNQFRKTLTSHTDIVAQWSVFIRQLRALNPTVKCVFSVSPVRYLRDGAHGNQLSKAQLLLAMEELISQFKDVHYFPAYEIVLDELRDYRFYAEDMLHPSNQAVEYIISKFSSCFMSDSTRRRIDRLEPLIKFLAHRPIKMTQKEWNLKVLEKQNEIEALLGEG